MYGAEMPDSRFKHCLYMQLFASCRSVSVTWGFELSVDDAGKLDRVGDEAELWKYKGDGNFCMFNRH